MLLMKRRVRSPMRNIVRSKIPLAPRTTVEMAEYAATQIRDAIIEGIYRPGDRLVEMDLAAQMHVSRHPVREALRRLDREGFVAVRANRGAIVAEVDAISILEVYEIRAVLGALALRHLLLGRQGPSPQYLRKLEQLAQKARDHAAKDQQKAMIHYDLQFQATVVEASGLSRIATYFRELNAEVQRFNNALRIIYPNKEATIELHIFGLLHAIRAGDLAEAERIWHDKFVTAATRFMAQIPDADEYRMRDASWLLFAAGPVSEQSPSKADMPQITSMPTRAARSDAAAASRLPNAFKVPRRRSPATNKAPLVPNS
jgi:DNA-binding GntR family transcriptional regulator